MRSFPTPNQSGILGRAEDKELLSDIPKGNAGNASKEMPRWRKQWSGDIREILTFLLQAALSVEEPLLGQEHHSRDRAGAEVTLTRNQAMGAWNGLGGKRA